MTSIAPTVVYPSLISRACATLDESPMFKDAPDGYLRVILRIIKKINLKRLSAPILASRATLAEESGKSVETVHRVVRWLEEHGLVRREQRARPELRGSSSPLIPTAQLRIQDEWSGGAYSVDKIPIAIAIPLAVSSTVEKSLLDMVEQYVTPPNATSFRDFDFFMEAAALGEILNGKSISNFETLGSIGRYYDDCVLKGISTGFVNESKYHRSSRLLVDSYMPWGVYFTQITNPDGSKTVHTC